MVLYPVEEVPRCLASVIGVRLGGYVNVKRIFMFIDSRAAANERTDIYFHMGDFEIEVLVPVPCPFHSLLGSFRHVLSARQRSLCKFNYRSRLLPTECQGLYVQVRDVTSCRRLSNPGQWWDVVSLSESMLFWWKQFGDMNNSLARRMRNLCIPYRIVVW
jgi:hypothetical protein